MGMTTLYDTVKIQYGWKPGGERYSIPLRINQRPYTRLSYDTGTYKTVIRKKDAIEFGFGLLVPDRYETSKVGFTSEKVESPIYKIMMQIGDTPPFETEVKIGITEVEDVIPSYMSHEDMMKSGYIPILYGKESILVPPGTITPDSDVQIKYGGGKLGYFPYMDVNINGQLVTLRVDTGVNVTTIRMSDFMRWGLGSKFARPNIEEGEGIVSFDPSELTNEPLNLNAEVTMQIGNSEPFQTTISVVPDTILNFIGEKDIQKSGYAQIWNKRLKLVPHEEVLIENQFNDEHRIGYYIGAY